MKISISKLYPCFMPRPCHHTIAECSDKWSQVRTKEEKGNLRRGFWLQLEAKKLVSHWFRHPADNLGLVVHAYDAQGRKLLAVTDPPPGRDSLVSDTLLRANDGAWSASDQNRYLERYLSEGT
ncbi:putative myostatin [Ixodes scapularis]